MKDQVVGQATSTLQQARDRASSSLGESKGQFADQFGTIAEALRRTTEHLRSEDQQRIAGITETVARQVDQVANYLGTRMPRAMRTDLENLARRQPAIVLGGALMLGLIGARFLKSSQRDAVPRRRIMAATAVRQRRLRPVLRQTLSSRAASTVLEDAESAASRSAGYQGGGYAGA